MKDLQHHLGWELLKFSNLKSFFFRSSNWKFPKMFLFGEVRGGFKTFSYWLFLFCFSAFTCKNSVENTNFSLFFILGRGFLLQGEGRGQWKPRGYITGSSLPLCSVVKLICIFEDSPRHQATFTWSSWSTSQSHPFWLLVGTLQPGVTKCWMVSRT